MDYLGFGYVVDSCPENLTEQTAAASRLKCGVDKFGNSQYLCVPNFKKTAIVEYCYKGTVGLHKKGSCLVVNDDGIVDIVSCGSFTEGCTTDFFKSSDLYQYPACHQIDTEARCFSADPACHQIDPEITRNISFVTSNTTSSEFSTTLNYTDSSKNIEYSQISPQAITGITFGLLFVFIGILFIGYLYLRSRKKKRKQKETVASEREPFDLEENVRLGEIEINDEDEEDPLNPKEGDVGLRKVEGTNTEQLRENDRTMRKTQRDLTRDRDKLEREEKKIAATVLVKQLLAIRKQKTKSYSVGSKISSIGNQQKLMHSNMKMAGAMATTTKTMQQMNKVMDPQKTAKMMQDFERENMKMGMSEDMINDTLDDILGESGDEEESDAVVNQVLDEIGIEITGKMVSAPAAPSRGLGETSKS